MICNNCSNIIDDGLTKCPYCDSVIQDDLNSDDDFDLDLNDLKRLIPSSGLLNDDDDSTDDDSTDDDSIDDDSIDVDSIDVVSSIDFSPTDEDDFANTDSLLLDLDSAIDIVHEEDDENDFNEIKELLDVGDNVSIQEKMDADLDAKDLSTSLTHLIRDDIKRKGYGKDHNNSQKNQPNMLRKLILKFISLTLVSVILCGFIAYNFIRIRIYENMLFYDMSLEPKELLKLEKDIYEIFLSSKDSHEHVESQFMLYQNNNLSKEDFIEIIDISIAQQNQLLIELQVLSFKDALKYNFEVSKYIYNSLVYFNDVLEYVNINDPYGIKGISFKMNSIEEGILSKREELLKAVNQIKTNLF